MTCIFCQIVEGKAPCHKVWEDEHHLAFFVDFSEYRWVYRSDPEKNITPATRSIYHRRR